MPDTPTLLPVPCTGNAIMLAAWKCKSDGSGWEAIYVPASDVGSAIVASAPPCGGDCAKKVDLVMDLASKKWKPEDIERVLKAL